MKKFSTSLLLAIAVGVGSLSIATTASASNSKRFNSTISQPASAVQVNVIIGDELAYRADHLSPKLRDRASSRSLNNGFAGKGFYGQKDLDKLASRLKRRMETRLEKSGIEVSDQATTVLNLVITNAEPNQPTFNQLSKNVSLSSQSYGLGGAAFEGTITIDGVQSGTISYAWFDTNIRFAARAGIWTDANRAIDKFARKTAKSLR